MSKTMKDAVSFTHERGSMLTIDSSNDYLIDWTVIGGGFRASGGGGPVSAGRVLAYKIKEELANGRKIKMCSPDAVPDDALVCTISSCGSPESITEHPERLNFNTWLNAWKQIQNLTVEKENTEITYVMAVEIGAWSSCAALIIAMMVEDIILIDGDGAGRAIPVYELSRMSRLTCNPTIIANGDEDYDKAIKVGLFVEDVVVMQSLAQSVLVANGFDSIGALAIWVATGAQVNEWVIPYTYTEYVFPAAVAMINGMRTTDPYAYLVEQIPEAKMIVQGRVTDIISSTSHTLDSVQVIVDGRNCNNDPVHATVYALNENLYAFSSDYDLPVIVGPDCLCWATTQQPPEKKDSSQIYAIQGLDNSNITVGMEVCLVGIPTNSYIASDELINERWRSHMAETGYGGKQQSGLFLKKEE